jgi:hypothetical protein
MLIVLPGVNQSVRSGLFLSLRVVVDGYSQQFARNESVLPADAHEIAEPPLPLRTLSDQLVPVILLAPHYFSVTGAPETILRSGM